MSRDKPEHVLHASVNRLLPVDEAALIFGVGRTTFLEMVNEDRAPKPVRLSAKIVRWRLSDLQAFLEKLQAAA